MIDITNQKFGILTVLKKDVDFKPPRYKYTKWICQCECGNIKSISYTSLKMGKTKSCGCQAHKGVKGLNKTHGMSNTRIYREWRNMRNRCKGNMKCAKNYSQRGISVCSEWKNNFISFYKWAIQNGYSDSLTLDRIDNNKGYSPDNCRWVTGIEQMRNRTNTIYVMYEGEKCALSKLCEDFNFPYKTAYKRYCRAKTKGIMLDVDKLLAPINTDKIAFKYRK